MPRFVIVLSCLAIAGCQLPHARSAPRSYPIGRYDSTPAEACQPAGSARLTLAIVAPRWQDPVYPSAIRQASTIGSGGARVIQDLAQALKGDFLELITCRGYLAKGPFDSFDAMVYPDREASQLLLEPEIDIALRVHSLVQDSPDFITAIIAKQAPMAFRGIAGIAGRISVTLKEPITGTRLWTRSIEVPADTAAFVTDLKAPYSPHYSADQLSQAIVNDPGFGAAVIPKLEAMYGRVLRTAENHLNARELNVVAAQAVSVRRKSVIVAPR